MALAASLVVGAVFLGYQAGLQQAVPVASQPEVLARLEAVSAERDALRAGASTAESRLRMASAAQERMAQQLRAAQEEAGQLKEDLAFFEALLPADNHKGGIHIRSFRVEAGMADTQRLQYRLLLMQGGARAFAEPAEFRGELEFVVAMVRKGKPATLTVPAARQAGTALRVRHYQRLEGELDIPPGADVRHVTVRVMQNGTLRAKQSATFQRPASDGQESIKE
ncbi:hypothetical protein LMG23992_05016 [Cupriavidus laharis]|uniref:DNA-binding protein n=1 Tax=Cupriavidus laharis TaxID=151654 RepID=A0ABM8XT69_9BURK|nr:DUF6776 family protein [Cupriavidus laharis]CAG9183536.1 hypothetical protein LMG23992_05016 [Cupriavidus laharis]